MAQEAGAKKVYFASSYPPITYIASVSFSIIFTKLLSSHPHIYGIDLATSTELATHKRNHKAIIALINTDDIIFLALEDLKVACPKPSPHPNQCFEVNVFCGRYIMPVSQGYLEDLEKTHGVNIKHNGAFVTVRDSITARQKVFEHSDVSLHNLIGDH
jgi:amidophosphoribosyltransferase